MRDSYTNLIIKDVFLKHKIYIKYIFLKHKVYIVSYNVKTVENSFTRCGRERYIYNDNTE